jgi:tetratricopeptide (TPR) repeat protein
VAEQNAGAVYKAESFLAIGQVEKADTVVRTALGQDPADAELLLVLAQVLEHQSRWPEVIETAQAALASHPKSTSARLKIAWAAYRLDDYVLMREQVTAVLDQHPKSPQALMYLAIHDSLDGSTAGRERARTHYLQALEFSDGGTPWLIRTAARVEVTLGDVKQAGALIDSGLERFPTDVALLTAKADLKATPAGQSLTILEGLLSSSPMDPYLRSRFSRLLAERQREILIALWLVPVALTLGFTFLDHLWRVIPVIAVVVLGLGLMSLRAQSKNSFTPAMLATLDPRAQWRVVTRITSRISVTCVVVGGILLALNVPVGGWLLIAATLGWVVTRVATLRHEKSEARHFDEEIATQQGPAAASQPRKPANGPFSADLYRDRSQYAVVYTLLLFPLALVALGGTYVSPPNVAAHTLAVVVAVVALTTLAEPVRRSRFSARLTSVAWNALLLVLPAVFYGGLLAVSLTGLAGATAQWNAVNPTPPSSPTQDDAPSDPEDPLGDPTVGPVLPDFDATPKPMPTFTVPSFDFTIPPVVPPAE